MKIFKFRTCYNKTNKNKEMANYWDTLPSDVKDIIYQMNPEHRIVFNSFKGELMLKATLYRLNHIHGLSSEHIVSGTQYTTLLLFEALINDPDHIIDQLVQCKCCARHTEKRPISLRNKGDYDQTSIPPWNDTPGGFTLKKNNCKCFCRSYSRIIFELFHH